MPHALASFVKALKAKQHRPLLWACLICLLFGMAEIGAPFDEYMRGMRDQVRSRPVSGKIVLLLADDESSADGAGFSWSRNELASLVTILRSAGASRIAITKVIAPRPKGNSSDALVSALRSMPMRSIVATSFEIDPETGEKRSSAGTGDMHDVAESAIINQYYNAFGRVQSVPYRLPVGGRSYRSVSAALAQSDGRVSAMAPIDYAIEADTVPTLDVGKVLRHELGDEVRGRTVVIGTAQSRMNISRHNRLPVAYGHILGAETMMRGRPIDLGWVPPFSLALIAALGIWFKNRRTAALLALAAAFLFTVVTGFLESRLIFTNVSAAALLVGLVLGIRGWRSYKSRAERHNILTGLPNLAALKARAVLPADIVIAARVLNYPALVAVVASSEADLANQIALRLAPAGQVDLYHGDHGIFAWVVPASEKEALADHLDALHAFFLKPLNIGSFQVDVSVSFGVDATTGGDAASRLGCALVAADEAADQGHRWKYYDMAGHDESHWKVSLLGRLDSAIENGEVWVAYQPKVDIAKSSVTGVEALARWTHPERGAISPEQFIPMAESHGRIDKLTYFVLDEALAMLAGLGSAQRNLTVAVNLSARMFERREFIGRVKASLKRFAIAPQRLTMEITESAAAENEAEMLATVEALIALGVRVSIDDYGTGYSTLEYLKKVRASEIKIDRSFVSGMERGKSDFMLVKATIDLAHSLGHKVVAEGVETKETLALLSGLGCDLAQGFLIARPMPRANLFSFLAEKRALAA